MTQIPEGAQRSEDGNYWWDGSEWQLVDQGAAGAAPAAAAGPQGAGGQAAGDQGAAGAAPAAGADPAQPAGAAGAAGTPGQGEVTHEELAAITSEDQITERIHPYLAPDGDSVPDDPSEAEGADVLSDEPAPDAGGQS